MNMKEASNSKQINLLSIPNTSSNIQAVTEDKIKQINSNFSLPLFRTLGPGQQKELL